MLLGCDYTLGVHGVGIVNGCLGWPVLVPMLHCYYDYNYYYQYYYYTDGTSSIWDVVLEKESGASNIQETSIDDSTRCVPSPLAGRLEIVRAFSPERDGMSSLEARRDSWHETNVTQMTGLLCDQTHSGESLSSGMAPTPQRLPLLVPECGQLG